MHKLIPCSPFHNEPTEINVYVVLLARCNIPRLSCEFVKRFKVVVFLVYHGVDIYRLFTIPVKDQN